MAWSGYRAPILGRSIAVQLLLQLAEVCFGTVCACLGAGSLQLDAPQLLLDFGQVLARQRRSAVSFIETVACAACQPRETPAASARLHVEVY